MRTGIWLVGARGSVAVTSMVGALALRAGLVEPIGCVTELPALRSPALPGFADLVFGGHDIAATPLVKKAESLAAAGVLPARLVAAARRTSWPRSKTRSGPCPTGRDAGRRRPPRIAADLTDFRERHGLDRVVVVNVSTTEPRPGTASGARRPGRAGARAGRPSRRCCRPAPLYAYAAFTAGCSFVDFTPSTGARLPALDRAGRARAACRTPGTTARPARRWSSRCWRRCSRMRNLKVRTWSGINLLGGGDGANLAEPGRQRGQGRPASSGCSARRSATSRRATPASSTSTTSATSRPPGTWSPSPASSAPRMRMEFTWHGCDSALAAPLVLDLARLTAAAHRAGRAGPLAELAFFFKDPLGDGPHALAEQWATLCAFVAGSARGARPMGLMSRAARPRRAGPGAGRAVRARRRGGRRRRRRRARPPDARPWPAPRCCLYWAGMAANDWADRELDAVERPERPIPSAGSRRGTALGVAAGLTAAGLGLAGLAGGRRALAVGGAAGRRGLGVRPDGQEHRRRARPVMAACRGLDVLLGATGGRPRRARSRRR